MTKKLNSFNKGWKTYLVIVAVFIGGLWTYTWFSGMQPALLTSWFTHTVYTALLNRLVDFFSLPVKKIPYLYRYLTGLNYLWIIMMIVFLTLSTKLLIWLNTYKKNTSLPAWKKLNNIKLFVANYQQYLLLSIIITFTCSLNSYLLLFNHQIFAYAGKIFYSTSEYQLLLSSLYMTSLTVVLGLMLINLDFNYRLRGR